MRSRLGNVAGGGGWLTVKNNVKKKRRGARIGGHDGTQCMRQHKNKEGKVGELKKKGCGRSEGGREEGKWMTTGERKDRTGE